MVRQRQFMLAVILAIVGVVSAGVPARVLVHTGLTPAVHLLAEDNNPQPAI